jgi:hypothetical protein
VRGRKKGAPLLRRAEEGRGHTGTPTTRQGRSAPPPHRAGRGRRRERGAGSEEPGARTGAEGDDRWREHLLHRERLHRPEHHRHATDDPKPVTTTPPPHREHRPANLFSPPPWSLSCDESATSRRVACIFLPGCWPSRRRTAVPRRRGLLSRPCSWAPLSPCEEGVWVRPSSRVFLCRDGCVRRRLASSCASGYQSAAPSGHGEAARAQARLWPRTGTLWTGSRDSLVCLRAPAAARSAWTFHVLVLAVAVRFPCEPVGVLCLGAGVVDAAATPRATPLVTGALLRVGIRGRRAPACW